MKQVEEILDLVDDQDRVINSLPRSEVYQKGLCHQMRAVWLLLKNSEGKFWIPRRCYSRGHLPGYLDGSVVGHVKAGETYEQALIREALEEIGIDINQMNYHYIGKITPHEDKSFCFASVYELEMDEAPQNWNRDEFCEWFWLSPEEIMSKFAQGECIKDSLPLIIQKFYH